MNRAVVVVVCCLLMSTAGATALATQSGTFSVTIDDSIDTPTKTVTVDGDSYTVDSVARVSQGEALTVRTDGPAGESYRVYIHSNDDGSRSVYDTKYVSADGSPTVSFDTSSFEAGSYVVSIYHDGTYYAPQPLVIPAYDVTVETPDTVKASGTLEITPTLTETPSDKTVESVEVVVASDETTKRVDASHSDGSYVATLDLDTIPAGDYEVHAVVYGSETTPRETNEVIGISDSTSLTIETTPDSTTSSSPGGGSTTTKTTAPTTSPTDRTSTSNTQATSDRQISTSPATTTPATTNAATTAATTQLPTETTQSTTQTTNQSSSTKTVITPDSATSTTTTPASNGVVGGTPLYLLALLATLALLVRS